MLELICAPSGSGKTETLIGRIRADIENGVRCFLLIPEQQAYISERDLPASLPKNAGLYFEAVNFSRLAKDIFHAYGGLTRVPLSGGMRTLLMWNTMRTLSPLFKQYKGQTRGDTTLAGLMLQTVTELRANGIDSAQLEEAASKLPADSPLAKKLSDIALADAAFHERLGAEFDADATDELLMMAEKLREHRFFDGCHVYIDSFTDFTVPEYAVLREILRQASCVTVSLCADDFHSTLPHFAVVTETARRLLKLASAVGCPCKKTLLSAKTDKKPRTLQILERGLWNFSLTTENRETPPEDERDTVRLFTCANIYDEAEAAAVHICELVQSGLRYGDIAVVARDIEVYRGVLDAALERHGIPYFLSERSDLSSKHVSRLILSALRAVSRNYRQADVIALLKTGLCGVDLRDAAMFEEYCETWHIGGSRFLDELWSMNPDGLTTERSERAEHILEAANRTRATLIPPLEKLRTDLRRSPKLIDRCRALYEYLRRIQLSERLSERARHELSMGQHREAGETVRLYDFILESVTATCRMMPDEELTTEEFISALSLLFSNSDLGSIPDVQDCVIVGSASTLRVENVRASLLLGLCEGEFPRSVQDNGMLSEGDRRTLRDSLDITLDSDERMRSAAELFYVYRAMTKPTEFLSLFTVEQETDGTSARTPSLAFSRVAFLLDRKPVSYDPAEVRQLLGEVLSERETALCISPTQEPVTLRLSQTKIQTFVQCPYRYYVTYQLHLREQKDSSPSYADDGTFLHYIFEHFLRRALNEDGTLSIPPMEEVDGIADDIIEEYLALVCPIPPEKMDNRLLHLYARLRKLALLMLKTILNELRAGAFVPYRFEQVIGGKGKTDLPALRLSLRDGSVVTLHGKIDRVDVYRTDKKTYIRVVDYKSGQHTFSLQDVQSGLDIQLVLYLYAYRAADPQVSAASAYYMALASENGEKTISRNGFCLDSDEIKAALDGDGTLATSKKLLKLTEEQIAQLEEEMKTAVCTVGEQILSGALPKTPSADACKFCPVRTHCAQAVRD